MDLIDDLAERAMRSGRRVGLVVGYLAGGEQWVRGYGRSGTGARDRPDGGTIFEIGSITKVFTGLLLADLAERGIVGLDDPLARYLPASASRADLRRAGDHPRRPRQPYQWAAARPQGDAGPVAG